MKSSVDIALEAIAADIEKTIQENEGPSHPLAGRAHEVLTESPEYVLRDLRSMFEESLTKLRHFDQEFLSENKSHWGTALDGLRFYIHITGEVAEKFIRRIQAEPSGFDDSVLRALSRLHAKGCLMAREGHCLLENGFSDGAFSRWRSLHEVVVTASFIRKNGADAAEAYFSHEAVDAYQLMLAYKKHEGLLQVPTPSETELSAAKSRYDQARHRYGKDFKRSYAWAAPFLDSFSRSFSDLEIAVGLDHWRPFYKWASQGIHPTARGSRSPLGHPDGQDNHFLVGPSNAGLSIPGQSIAISLFHLTNELLLYTPGLDDLVHLKVLHTLMDEVATRFFEAE